jgi:hypothetical protein
MKTSWSVFDQRRSILSMIAVTSPSLRGIVLISTWSRKRKCHFLRGAQQTLIPSLIRACAKYSLWSLLGVWKGNCAGKLVLWCSRVSFTYSLCFGGGAVAGGKGLTFVENFPIGQVVLFGLSLAFGCVWGCFLMGYKMFMVYYTNWNIPCLFFQLLGDGIGWMQVERIGWREL